eukprot:37897-Chlamydomonas_euryale.AAC.10
MAAVSHTGGRFPVCLEQFAINESTTVCNSLQSNADDPGFEDAGCSGAPRSFGRRCLGRMGQWFCWTRSVCGWLGVRLWSLDADACDDTGYAQMTHRLWWSAAETHTHAGCSIYCGAVRRPRHSRPDRQGKRTTADRNYVLQGHLLLVRQVQLGRLR